MTRYIKILFVLVLFTIGQSAVAQSARPSNPVKWRVNVKMSSATEGEVIITASIDDGWHLYGMDIPKGGPKPTRIEFADSKGVTFVGELKSSVEPVKYRDDMFGMTLSCWEKRVTFRRKFKVTDKKTAQIGGSISFMSCNNQNCSAPSVEKFSKKVPLK